VKYTSANCQQPRSKGNQ